MSGLSTFVQGQVIRRWGIEVVLYLHHPHRFLSIYGDVSQFVFVFHSEPVATRQGKTLSVNLSREELEVSDDLLVGPHHHLNCI